MECCILKDREGKILSKRLYMYTNIDIVQKVLSDYNKISL